ncbi:putative F-box protein [Iris pallida]|uniref:F-box protein n=1 Tax=Iris pallida TaxID=29817 RepID=A0AAX6GL65_IRIPA|nr:putative F-box protein [Iris pallida]
MAGCISCFGRFSSRKGTPGRKQGRAATPVVPPRLGDSSKWATLPPDILSTIADRLPIPERVRVRAVCTTWFQSLEGPCPYFRDGRPHLMINRYADDGSDLRMARPLDGGWFSAPLLPTAGGKVWCVGHKDGWVVSVHDLDITLFNPVTEEQVKFPRFYDMPGVDVKALPCVGKVVLSCTPTTSPGGIITAMALARDRNIAYAKSTDRNWTTIPVADDNIVRDFVYHNGLFCVLCSGPVDWEEDDDDEDVVRSYRRSNLSMLSFDELGYTSVSYKYVDRLEGGMLSLASSPNDLLLVLGIPEEHSAKYSKFKIMTFQPTQRNKWVQVEDLGEHCLLLDAVQSTLLPVADAAGLERNRVYLGGLYMSSTNELVVTTGAFDVATGASEPCFPSTSPLETLHDVIPCWFTPILS